MPTSAHNEVEHAARRRGPVQCKPLLDAATKNLFSNNAFRITGLSVEAAPREVAKHADKLKLLQELGQSASIHTGAFALHPPPTLDQIREATQRLKDPEKRLIDEFFWFWPCEPAGPTPDPALHALASGNAEAALKIWAQNETNPNSGVVAMHNIAVYWLLRALDLENDDTVPDANLAQEQTAEKYWRNSLKRWKYLTSDDLLWDKVAARVRQIDDPRLTGFLRKMRLTLPHALAKVNAELALAHAENGRTSLAKMHAHFLREGSEGSSTVEPALELALAPARARLREHIRHAKHAAEQNPETANRAARELLAQAGPLIPIFNLLFLDAEHPVKDLLDEAATTCLDCLVSYQKKTDDNCEFVNLLEMVLPMAGAPEVRQRIEKNIQIGKNNLATATLEPAYALLKAIQDSRDDPRTRLKRFLRDFTKAIAAITDDPASSPKPGGSLRGTEAYSKLLDSAAVVLRGISVDAWNFVQLESPPLDAWFLGGDIRTDLKSIRCPDTATALAAIELALKHAQAPDFRQRLLDDQNTMRRLLAEHRAARPPNDFKPAVIDDFKPAVIVLSVVGFIVFLGILASSVSTRTSPREDSSTPPSAPNSRPYTPTPASPQGPSYRVPAHISTQLRQESAAIEAQRLSTTRLQNELDNLAAEIEADRSTLDRTSQFATGQFNRKVDAYNVKLEKAKVEVQSLNQMVDSYNSKLRLYGR